MDKGHTEKELKRKLLDDDQQEVAKTGDEKSYHKKQVRLCPFNTPINLYFRKKRKSIQKQK